MTQTDERALPLPGEIPGAVDLGRLGVQTREALSALHECINESFRSATGLRSARVAWDQARQQLLSARAEYEALETEIADGATASFDSFSSLLDFGINALRLRLGDESPDPIVRVRYLDGVPVAWRVADGQTIDDPLSTEGQTLWQTAGDDELAPPVSATVAGRSWRWAPALPLPMNEASKKDRKKGLYGYRLRFNPLGRFGPAAARLSVISGFSAVLVACPNDLLPVGCALTVTSLWNAKPSIASFLGYCRHPDTGEIVPLCCVRARQGTRIVFSWASHATVWPTSRRPAKKLLKFNGPLYTRGVYYQPTLVQGYSGVAILGQQYGKTRWARSSHAFANAVRASCRVNCVPSNEAYHNWTASAIISANDDPIT